MEETLREFYSVSDILQYAYHSEARLLTPQMNVEMSIPATNPAELTPLEKLVDGGLMKKRAMRNLGMIHRHTVGVRYRLPFDDDLYGIHEYNIRSLSKYIQKEKPRIRNIYFIQDVIRDWSYHGQPHHRLSKASKSISLQWWARHMGIPHGTVWNWAMSEEPERGSIKWLCDWLLMSAEYKLEPVLGHLLVGRQGS